ncbi:putative basal body component [Trypanosoma rangeli]|uniref:Putative basal body component n=1 Tax=Trypanosoma rangeli TaxID=5698 RepID=A0A3R7MY80_TRYRA|nr:putative basal body component [Trypanosoma rangeli]RNF09892.1 putative basal body component [Trypanosoma rangeli]|eukprot:RNF09892.1 putative basal body component [Trypanosoma rangeli]
MAHVDQLLEEYLRVINSKDDEIHELIRGLEERRCELKKKEDTYKVDVVSAQRRLEKARRQLRRMGQKLQVNEEHIDQLVRRNDVMKMQADAMEQKVIEVTNLLDRSKESHGREMEEMRQRHCEEVRSLHVERDNLMSELTHAQQKHLDAQRTMEACEARAQQLNAREAAHEELRKAFDDVRREMEFMVSAQKHADALAVCEESMRSQKAAAAAEIEDLNAQLLIAKRVSGECQGELNDLRVMHVQLQKRLAETSQEKEEAQQLLDAERESRKNLVALHQREVVKAREAAEQATAKLTATAEQLQCGQAKTRALEGRLSELSEAFEQEVRRGGEERGKMSLQLTALQTKLTEQQQEMERRQRSLEASSAELRELHASLATAKEEHLRCIAELKEKLTLAVAERDRLREDRDRLTFELKDLQHQLGSLNERFVGEKRALATRNEDANIVIDRMKDQLRDREHQQQTLVATQEKRLQELAWAHKTELAECRRVLESEISELRQRLNFASAQLAEEVATNKANQRDVQAANEVARKMREESEQRASDVRESARALEDARGESMTLREALAKQRQLVDVAAETEARLRKSLEKVESDRAAEARQHELTVQALGDAKEKLAASRSEVTQLRRELARAQEERAKRELVNRAAQLRKSQKQVEQLERELVTLRQERQHQLASLEKMGEAYESSQKARRDATDELHRLHAELQQKTKEYAGVAQHAKEVEELAKRSCEELEREMARRDATIDSMQQDASLLADERAKVAVLEERLNHQADLSRRDADLLHSRIAALEKELDARDAQLHHQAAEAEEMAEQFRALQSRAGELEEAVTQKEKKHALRKEALRKALEQVDAAVEQKVAAEHILSKANTSREKSVESYKAESGRMQEQLQVARAAQHAAELRLSSQEEALAEATRTLSATQEVQQQQLRRLKEEHTTVLAKASDELNAALKRVDYLTHELAQSRQALREVEEAKEEALRYVKDSQRRLLASYSRLVSNMAEEVMMTKEMFGDFVISVTTRSFYQLRKIAHEGWDIAMSFKQQCGEGLRQLKEKMEREMEELKRAHADEVQVVRDERNREVSKLGLQHEATAAQLRQELVDATERVSREREAALKECHRKEEQLQRERLELESARLEIAHRGDQIAALKEQLRGFEQRSEAERTLLDQERRTLQQQQERIRQRLDDRTMEQNKSEVEARELRCEISAMQHVLQEKDNALASERERARQESRRLTALTAAKETLHRQIEEQRRQMQLLQLQLSAAKQGAQQSTHTAASQQSRLEERVAELTKTLYTVESENQRLGRQTHKDEKKIAVLEKELTESRKREAELSSQLQTRKSESSALKERCANLESLKHIAEVALAETRLREKDLLEKIEELRSAQQLMQLCFDKQQEQLEVGRRIHEQDVNRSGLLYKHDR